MARSRISVLLQILTGMFVLFFGLLGVGFGLLAILDPVGTKMADDADPFGPPPSALSSLLLTIIFAAITAFGFLIIWVADKNPRNGS